MSDGNEKKEGKPVSPDDIREMLKGLNVEEKERKAAEHRFWDTQPVAKLDEDVSEARGALEGPDKEVRQTPYALPEGFVWSDVDIDDDEQIGDAFTLLAKSYVEDDDGMFRFEYPVPFLRWALKPPGFRRDWHVGVRGAKKGNLLAFITAVPATIRVGDKSMKMVEINFLCVHKKLRSKRLAPVLIREITRRVNLTGVFQAVYTAGIELPKPWSKARYWHRSLNPRKLVDIGFSAPPRGRTTMRMLQARYRLPDETELPFVPYTPSDASEVAPMLEEYLNKFTVSPVLTADEVNHYFTPREGVVDSFVLREKPEKEGGTGPVIAFLSFYCLPSKILRHERHKVLKAAYCFYTCSPSIERYALLRTALILARQRDYDVFNALDIQDNDVKLLSELKFGIGDGNLHYYMYNYIHPEVLPGQCGLVLM